MFKNMKLATKIATGFGAVILIALTLGGLAVFNMLGVKTDSVKLAQEYVPEVDIANEMRGATNRVMFEMRGYGNTEEDAYYKLAQVEFAALDKALDDARELAKEAKSLKQLSTQLAEAEKARQEYGRLSDETKTTIEALTVVRGRLEKGAAQYMENCADFLASQNEALESEARSNAGAAKILERNKKVTIVNDIIDLGNDTRIATWRSQALREPKIIREAMPNFDKMETSFTDLRAITYQDADIQSITATRAAALEYKSAMTDLLTNWEKLQDLGRKRLVASDALITATKTTAEAGMEQTKEIASKAAASLTSSSVVMIIGLVIALVVGVFLAITITLGITGPINQIISGLTSGSGAVSAASGQLSGSSQDLSQGASEQASSLEEVSSSLEEMASMTKQNADNARQADQLMSDSKALVTQGQSAMGKLGEAMNEIKNSADRTAKIIKNIDEIAFQTNLLALNAAVEAARAGEAGKGFAVVAEEVRSLAMRAAEAAKDTSALIEQSQKSSENGVGLAQDTSKSITNIAESSLKVAGLVAEIAAASNEQAQGIDQVNTAVAQMDQVTQRNAATAEESSSAAEELSAQAQSLNEIVGQMVSLVGGTANGSGAAVQSYGSGARNIGHSVQRAISAPKKVLTSARVGVAKRSSEVRPEQVLPLNDDDLKEF